MARALYNGLNERSLRVWLLIFFVALSIPIALLVLRAQAQMKWEVFHQWRVSAEELSARIDDSARRILAIEEERSFGDYSFLVLAGDPGATYLQRSPLSSFPVVSEVPGLIGHFQVDRNGNLSSPIIPEQNTPYEDYGVNSAEYRERIALNERIGRILGSVDTGDPGRRQPAAGSPAGRSVAGQISAYAPEVAAAPAPAEAKSKVQSNVFDRLSESIGGMARQAQPSPEYARVDELELDVSRELDFQKRDKKKGQSLASAPLRKRESRKEQVATFELAEASTAMDMMDKDVATESYDLAIAADDANIVQAPAPATMDPRPMKQSSLGRVRFFDSEIDPFAFAILDAAHLVMFRNVWRDGERFIQGAVVERAGFTEGLVRRAYEGSAIAAMSRLIVAYDGNVIDEAGRAAPQSPTGQSGDLSGELLYRTRLSAPLGGLELLYTVAELPPGPGARYLAWVGLVLALVLCGGCFVIYRYGIGQITLFRQQQDFVSAVSHELKTPLTSIRMYSEILQAGWADEKKKAGYYTFIHDESERLSRLIANVLQLSRMTRGNHSVETRVLKARELLDVARSKISSQIEAAGFELVLDCDDDALDSEMTADADAFTQIMINLVDNAIKFSPEGVTRRIELSCRRERGPAVCFSVRDYGRGIEKDQLRKIFDLFYRPESELTRETVGTGIGLALVHQLTESMGGRTDVRNRDPGAEFRLIFPCAA